MVLSKSLADGLSPHLSKGDGPRDDLLGPVLPYEWTDSSPKGTRTWAGPPSPPSDSSVPHDPDRFFLFAPAPFGPLDTKESPSPASRPHSPASPRPPSSLKGYWPSPRTWTEHEEKTEPESYGLETKAEADQRRLGTPGNTTAGATWPGSDS